jgi:hypothetical protein
MTITNAQRCCRVAMGTHRGIRGRGRRFYRSPTLTSEKNVRMEELKARVDRDAYIVDPEAVAQALLRRSDPRVDPVALPPVSRPDGRIRQVNGTSRPWR